MSDHRRVLAFHLVFDFPHLHWIFSFIGDSHASIFDARQGIQVNSHFFKVICFYDNEWGYTSQIFRLIEHMDRIDHNR